MPFTITAGAATNSIFVDSTGRVGLRTATPVLDLHINTSNTPGIRLEQNNSGGFTAQTWDVAGNEANFFVRDVTGGSRLPFRIRPGAPTSSIDISASGDVGIGTASPSENLHVREDVNANSFILMQNPNVGTTAAAVVRAQSDVATVNFQAHGSARTLTRFGQILGGWTEMLGVAGDGLIVGTLGDTPLILGRNSTERLRIAADGVNVTGVLRVNGTPMAVPDYVFDPEYKLMPLTELAAYVEKERHLPEIPSAQDITAQGLDLGGMQLQLLKKVEELTLYTIAQAEQLQAQERTIRALDEKVARLEQRR